MATNSAESSDHVEHGSFPCSTTETQSGPPKANGHVEHNASFSLSATKATWCVPAESSSQTEHAAPSPPTTAWSPAATAWPYATIWYAAPTKSNPQVKHASPASSTATSR